MFTPAHPRFLGLLAASTLSAGMAQAAILAWEVTETVTVHGNPPRNGWYDVLLTVKNHGLDGQLTALAVGVPDANVWACTSRGGWQPWGNSGVHPAGTWDTEGVSDLLGGMTWDEFIGGQIRMDGSNYDWFALYYPDRNLGSGSGSAPGQSSSQFSYTTNSYPASPVAVGINGGLAGYAGSTTLVPEPETWGLMLAGLGLWAGRHGRAARGG